MSGTSNRSGKPITLEWFKENENAITRILDIGAGSGTYVDLIKQEHSLCQNAEWVAVEAWEEYINKYRLAEKYSTVLHQDARLLNWDEMGEFSVAIAGDVLEHMTKDEAIQLVEKVLHHCKTLIISIPIVHMPQEEIEGNPFEVHVKDDWSHEEVMVTWEPYIVDHYRKGSKSKIGVYWLSKQ